MPSGALVGISGEPARSRSLLVDLALHRCQSAPAEAAAAHDGDLERRIFELAGVSGLGRSMILERALRALGLSSVATLEVQGLLEQ